MQAFANALKPAAAELVRGIGYSLVSWVSRGDIQCAPCACPDCVCTPALSCPSVAYDLGSSRVIVDNAPWSLIGALALCGVLAAILCTALYRRPLVVAAEPDLLAAIREQGLAAKRRAQQRTLV